MKKGEQREARLNRSEYFSEGYFNLQQLYSQAQQIHEIHAMQPTSIIEVGLGNGFTSQFLKRAGFAVTTADINPALEPDICAPLRDLSSLVTGEHDLVVCCEVLEHMPLEELDANIAKLRSLGPRLFMTLPRFRKSFGIYGILRLPKLKPLRLALGVNLKLRRKLAEQHFWEVDYNQDCSEREIFRILEKYYKKVETSQALMNPYHIIFKAY